MWALSSEAHSLLSPFGGSSLSSMYSPPVGSSFHPISTFVTDQTPVSLPCCLVAMILCFLILRGRVQGAQPTHTGHLATSTHIDQSGQETFAQKLLRIDWIGALLFMGAGITLLLALNWGSSAEWSSARVIACFVVSGVLYIVWVAWEYVLERKQKSARTSRNPLMRTDPMIPLELFRSRDLCIAQYATFVSGMVMIVMFYFISNFFTSVGGLTGTDARTQLLYFAPGMVSRIIRCRQTTKNI